MGADFSFRFIPNGGRVKMRGRRTLRSGDAINPQGYRIAYASASRYVGGSNRAWVGEIAKRPGSLRWPAPHCARYEVYAPGSGGFLCSEPTFEWAVRQAVRHMFTGQIEPE